MLYTSSLLELTSLREHCEISAGVPRYTHSSHVAPSGGWADLTQLCSSNEHGQ